VGALLHVLRARAPVCGGRIGWTRLLVYDYSRISMILVVLVITTGTLEAVLVLPTINSLIDTTYGLVLLGKLLLVTTSLLGALLARRRLRHSMPTAAAIPLGRAVRVEAAALVGVLAVTAVLVSVAPPGPATRRPRRPARARRAGGARRHSRLGDHRDCHRQRRATRAAHERTRARRPRLRQHQPGTTFDAASGLPARRAVVRARGPAPEPDRARMRRGVFHTGPVNWRPGTNQLHLSIAAPPWPTGTATLEIPWPPRTEPALLPTVLTAMRAVPRLTVYQAVTSDYTGYPGNEIELPFSGGDFLGTEPYNSGGGNPVILNSTPGETEIGLAFPLRHRHPPVRRSRSQNPARGSHHPQPPDHVHL